jgi:uracil-DNA glycosylase
VPGTRLVVTAHPSSLLRIEDDDGKRATYEKFVADLKSAAAAVPSHHAHAKKL